MDPSVIHKLRRTQAWETAETAGVLAASDGCGVHAVAISAAPEA